MGYYHGATLEYGCLIKANKIEGELGKIIRDALSEWDCYIEDTLAEITPEGSDKNLYDMISDLGFEFSSVSHRGVNYPFITVKDFTSKSTHDIMAIEVTTAPELNLDNVKALLDLLCYQGDVTFGFMVRISCDRND